MARIALIADIHANLEALEAVLADIDGQSVDHVVCLGDIIGYGPDPARCIELVFERCEKIVLGNHDEAALGEGHEAFNPRARRALEVTRGLLEPKHLDLIRWLPDRARIEGVSIAHASFGPKRFEYLYTEEAAAESFEGMGTRFGAVGHTHIPSAFTCPAGRLDKRSDICAYPLCGNVITELPDDQMVLMNPGSVGQPRDRNPDASYGMLDLGSMTYEIRRVCYDVEPVQHKIASLGLPEFHGERLKIGA